MKGAAGGFQVEPEVFTRLKSGGPEHKNQVEAILFKSGASFEPTGRPFAGVTLRFEPAVNSLIWFHLVAGEARLDTLYTNRMTEEHSALVPPAFVGGVNCRLKKPDAS